jgi:hypothetical protein
MTRLSGPRRGSQLASSMRRLHSSSAMGIPSRSIRKGLRQTSLVDEEGYSL